MTIDILLLVVRGLVCCDYSPSPAVTSDIMQGTNSINNTLSSEPDTNACL
jgi:hypothetical protein